MESDRYLSPRHSFDVTSYNAHDAPSSGQLLTRRGAPIPKPVDPSGLILEAWAQGYMVGSLIIMAAITIANMRRGVLLHKLILVELIFGTFQGTFIFPNPPAYGWYESVGAIFLNTSWSLHNVIAWIKTKPFLSRRWSTFYITTVILAQGYWVVEIYANFAYFNGYNDIFLKTRPYEALFRDPWWIFSVINLFYNIHTSYHIPLTTIIRLSPRFGVLITAMVLSIIFIILDVLSVTNVLKHGLPDGLNPFWKLAFVFKCLTDSIILDDFKTALDKLARFKMEKDNFIDAQLMEEGEVGGNGHANGSAAFTSGSSFKCNGIDWDKDGNGECQAQGGAEMSFMDALNDGGPAASRARTRTQATTVSQKPQDPLSEAAIEQDRMDVAHARVRASFSTAKPIPAYDPVLTRQRTETNKRNSMLKAPLSPQVDEDIDQPAFASTGDFGRDRFTSTDASSTDGKSLKLGASWHEHVMDDPDMENPDVCKPE